MNYIIMDLEWNQPIVPKKRIKGLYGDIIQIGAIKVDENFNVIDEFNLIVKPSFYFKINKHIKELTGITQEMLDSAGKNFPQAISEFRNWAGDDYEIVTWSFSDISLLINNSKKHGLDYSWIPKCYDAQMMFDDQERQEGRNYALNYALFTFGEKPDNSHDALDDARSTIKVLRHLDLEEGLIDEFTWGYGYYEEDEAWEA